MNTMLMNTTIMNATVVNTTIMNATVVNTPVVNTTITIQMISLQVQKSLTQIHLLTKLIPLHRIPQGFSNFPDGTIGGSAV